MIFFPLALRLGFTSYEEACRRRETFPSDMNSERIGVELSRIARRFPTSRQYGQLPTVILRLFAHSAAMLPRLRLPRTWSFVCSLALENVRQEKTVARVSSDSYSRNLPVKNSRNRFPEREKGRREESFASKYIFERIPSNHIFVNGPFENNICDYLCSFKLNLRHSVDNWSRYVWNKIKVF